VKTHAVLRSLRLLLSIAFIVGGLPPWFGIARPASADANVVGRKSVEVVDIDDVIAYITASH